jgi:hypothetical protein
MIRRRRRDIDIFAVIDVDAVLHEQLELMQAAE